MGVLHELVRRIVENAGENAAVVLNAVKAGKGAYGYNAASVAGLLLTTEVMIADAPKDEAKHGHGAPGGMDDMGM